MTKRISLQALMIASALLLLAVSGSVVQAAEKDTAIDAAAQTYVGEIQFAQNSRFLSKDNVLSNKGLFLQAKKAFHEARMEIQSIKKGDESPRQGVPGFFESEDSEEDDQENQDEIVVGN